eukprot:6191443-Pleurochrysis_carterae.AAC.3
MYRDGYTWLRELDSCTSGAFRGRQVPAKRAMTAKERREARDRFMSPEPWASRRTLRYMQSQSEAGLKRAGLPSHKTAPSPTAVSNPLSKESFAMARSVPRYASSCGTSKTPLKPKHSQQAHEEQPTKSVVPVCLADGTQQIVDALFKQQEQAHDAEHARFYIALDRKLDGWRGSGFECAEDIAHPLTSRAGGRAGRMHS